MTPWYRLMGRQCYYRIVNARGGRVGKTQMNLNMFGCGQPSTKAQAAAGHRGPKLQRGTMAGREIHESSAYPGKI